MKKKSSKKKVKPKIEAGKRQYFDKHLLTKYLLGFPRFCRDEFLDVNSSLWDYWFKKKKYKLK